MERACETCLERISQKKTYSSDINMLKRKPPNEKHHMLPHYICEYEPKQNSIDFESAWKIFMKEDDNMVVKRRFEKIKKMMECKSYMKNEDIPENKEIFVYGFIHIKTDKIDNFILVGCQSDDIYMKFRNYLTSGQINLQIKR